ncbi:MAG TPA: SRPBCC family protein [Solirubrobacteraceae bacterium]|nr:SRPBCC family protein [Solirubrobacteraceae bacterium]
MKGIAAGAGAAALAPLAVKGAGRLARSLNAEGVDDIVHAPQHALQNATEKLGDHVGSGIGDKVSEKVDEAGGPSGMLKDTIKGALPFGGGGGGGNNKGGAEGVGKGRRMPVQQSVDIGIALETVYNQFTQYETWPTFMHRVTRVTQEDPCTVSFAVKIWGKTKEFTAKVETQRPDERVKWRASQGMTNVGVVTFHELAPNLTRVLVDMDVQPGGMVEKMARGMRHVKRAVRGDLHRFKAFIEMAEHETGAWRGIIEDGELVEDHDPSYDEAREYADLDELAGGDEQGDEDDEDDEAKDQKDEQEEDEEEQPRARRSRGQRSQSRSSNGSDPGSSRGRSSGRGRSAAASSSGGQSRSSSSRSRSGGSGGSSRSRATTSRSSSSGGRGGRRQSSSRNSQSD